MNNYVELPALRQTGVVKPEWKAINRKTESVVMIEPSVNETSEKGVDSRVKR